MSHEIAGNADLGIHLFAHSGDPAWHSLGEPIQEPMTVPEATEFAGLNYVIEKAPIAYDTSWGMLDDNRSVGLVRQPTKWDPEPRPLGIATEGYTLLQNMEIARLLEPLGEKWPIETVGALGDGERSFWVLNFGDYEVGGISSELMKRYLFVSDDKRAGKSFTMKPTNTRVVCNNTWVASMAEGGLTISIPHRGDVLDYAEFHLRLLENARESTVKITEKFDAMVKRKLDAEEANTLFYRAFPLPKPTKMQTIQLAIVDTPRFTILSEADQLKITKSLATYETEKAATERLVQAVRLNFEKINDEHPKIANTAYAAFNAVTELADHRVGRGDHSTVAHSLLFGNRAAEKDRAFAAAVSLL